MPDTATSKYFEVFNEIGIIEQLSRAVLEARLPPGMIISHFSVINHLIRVQDGRTPLELARAFQVPKTTMTHTLKGLVDHGYVEMRPNPKDGRSKRIWLKPAGRAMRDDAIVALSADFTKLFEGFGAERLIQMLPELRALRIFLDEARNTADQDVELAE